MSRPAEILLVEDNPDELELTLWALEEAAVVNPVHVARDGAEALEYLFATGRYAGLADGARALKLVLLDLKLPRVDGIEVLRRVKADERTRDIPVVILTCSTQECDQAASRGLGADSYVVKPIDGDAFVGAISAIGQCWIQLNERPSG